jgi:glutaredoxin 3
MQAVKMYTTAVCPYCIRAKQLLKLKGVEQIEEIRVDTHVGGHDDLVALDGRGGLAPLLAG